MKKQRNTWHSNIAEWKGVKETGQATVYRWRQIWQDHQRCSGDRITCYGIEEEMSKKKKMKQKSAEQVIWTGKNKNKISTQINVGSQSNTLQEKGLFERLFL